MTRISTPTIRTGVTAATAAPRTPVQPAAGTPDSPLPLSPAGVAALLRLAVVSVDSDGHVSHWNRGAEELFGHRWEAVFGQSAAGLLSAPAAVPAGPDAPAPDGCPPGGPPRDLFALLGGHARPAWAGTFPVAGRDGTPRETLWWSYRIADDAGPGLLLLAADAGRLRSGGLRITIGDRMLPYAPDAPGPAGLRVLPCLGPTPDQPGHHDALPDPAALAGRLGAVLPQVSRARLERLLKEVTRLGFPAVSVEGSAPLPVLPFEAVRPYDETPAATTRTTGRSPVFSVPLPDGRGPAALLPPPRDASGTDEPAGVPEVAAEPDRDEEFPPASPGHLVQQQLALLRETGTRVGTTLDLGTTAAELCRVAVPRFADFASVLIVDDAFSETAGTDPEYALHLGGPEGSPCEPAAFTGAPLTVRRIAIANRHPGGVWDRALEEGELFTLAAGPSHGLTEPFLLPVVDAAVADDLAADLGVPALGPLLPGRSVLLVPLTARGTLLGRMCFVREPQRLPFTAKDSATAVELAARGAVHLDNARLHRFESRAAATLQRSMLPTSPPRIPGVRIAHHYRPGNRQAQVGGDWFDAIQLPGGRVALIVGDVMGHGLLSAAVMGQFRTAVQTMAALDLPPAQLLRHLDNLAHRLGSDHLATCVYAVYDPIHRTLTLANAGHIPPVLARHDGVGELLQIPEGAPIGVGGVPFETVEMRVPDGSWLVLCTDGLVEVRGQGIDAGLAALCANVIEPQHTPEDVCSQILSRVHSEDRRDDVALLVARFEGIAPQNVAKWHLALDASEVRTAREVTRKQLATWDLGHLSDLAELLVSELVTNALRVASQEVTLRLMLVGKLLVEVSDDDHNLPQLRRADEDDENGRGLALVSNLSRRWGTSRKAVGKVVWFELPIPKG